MRPMKNTEKYARMILLPLVAFMLVLSTVLPSVVLAADSSIITVFPETITQDDINTKGATIKFSLNSDHSWAEGIKIENLIVNMSADSEKEVWDAYKPGIRLAIDKQFLTLTLPKADYDITADQTITVKLPTVLTGDESKAVKDVFVSFDITHTKTSTLTIDTTPTPLTEADIQTGQAKITLKLTGDEWNIDSTNGQDLINALVPKDQGEQWDKVKRMLSIPEAKGDTLTITLPFVDDYKLGTNQTITVKVPQHLLKNNTKINEAEFTIKAAPKVLITGTATPKVTQADIITGGKTIVVTVVNGVWAQDIERGSARQKLLKGFTFDSAYEDMINTRATVTRTNDEVVTIILPPLAEYKIAEETLITFDASAITTTSGSHTGTLDAFTITPTTNQSAAITGSIVGASEFDIAEGGKEMIVTLKNDSWTTDTSKLNAFQPKFVDADDKEITLAAKKVERTSDTVLTITLKEAPDFTLTDDISVKLTIPADILATSGSPITPSAFKITAVKAELPSGKDIVLDQVDIHKGGKSISVTLKNATFKEELEIDEALIDSIFETTNPISTALKDNLTNVTIAKNKLTIKLPAMPDYDSLTAETFGMKIPAGLIDHNTAKDLDVTGKITTGAVATVELDPNTATFTDREIKAGNAKINLTLTGTEWDPTLPTNRSKKTTLLRGFTVTDQTKEWGVLNKEIIAKGQFELSADQKTLTITVPEVAGYSIIRNQVVTIKVPKTVLVNYKEDIPVADQLTITVPTAGAGGTPLHALDAEALADAIANNSRLIVPSKKVEKIYMNTINTGKETSITTIEVTAAVDVKAVRATVTETTADGVESSQTRTLSGDTKFTFVYTNLERNSELEIIALDSTNKPLENEIYKKIGKGNKTYTEAPKKDLAGSYLLYDVLMQKNLLRDILKYYSIEDLLVIS